MPSGHELMSWGTHGVMGELKSLQMALTSSFLLSSCHWDLGVHAMIPWLPCPSCWLAVDQCLASCDPWRPQVSHSKWGVFQLAFASSLLLVVFSAVCCTVNSDGVTAFRARGFFVGLPFAPICLLVLRHLYELGCFR